MRSRTNTYQLALTGMLIAIGIVIPMFSPIKVVIEPAHLLCCLFRMEQT